MDKRWTLAIVTILMMILIYSFLNMVLKTDKRKKAPSRMYRDYSSYSRKSSSSDDDNYSSGKKIYSSGALTRQIKRNLFSSASMKVTTKSYDKFMASAFAKSKNKKITVNNPQFEKMLELSRKPVPELQLAMVAFREGEFEDAINKLNHALETLDPMEMKNRMQIYSLLAECYLKLKDDENYVDNKVKHIRILRKYNKLIKETFPNNPDEKDFMTTQEASANLLRIKGAVARLPDSPSVRELQKRAELDLQVARKVTQ